MAKKRKGNQRPLPELYKYGGPCKNISAKVLRCNAMKAEDLLYEDLAAPYWRFYWNEQNGAHFVVRDQIVEMRPDKFYLIAPETHYAAKGKGYFDHFYIHFSVDEPYNYFEDVFFEIDADSAHCILASKALKKMLRQGTTPPSPTLMMHYYTLIFYALSDLPEDLIAELPHDERLSWVIRYMEGNLKSKLSTEELSKVANMSPKSLFRLFNNQLGVSPQDYFKKLKIKQACFYLHYSQLNIEEIAEELGFSSRYHFTRVFSSIRNIPPAAFRKIGNSYYNAIKRI